MVIVLIKKQIVFCKRQLKLVVRAYHWGVKFIEFLDDTLASNFNPLRRLCARDDASYHIHTRTHSHVCDMCWR